MNKAKPNKESPEIDSEFVRLYYEHQYDRMAKHEEQRQTISNFVITLTVVALTFGFSNLALFNSQQANSQPTALPEKNLIVGLFLPVAIILINLFAIIYIRRSFSTGTIHQKRANRILELYAPYLRQIATDVSWSRKGTWWSRSVIEILIHVVLIAIITIIPIYIFLFNP